MTDLQTFQMVINGEWVDAEGSKTFETFNPYTAKPWALIPHGGAADVDAAVEAAYQAGRPGTEWRSMTPTARGHVLRKFADALMEASDDLAEIEVRDNGKLIAEMSVQCKYLT